MFDARQGWNVTYAPLVWGLLASAVLLFGMYFIAQEKMLTGWSLGYVVLGLATLQSILQFILFMHVGVESAPKWSLLIFLFMLLIVVILVGGSLWIMANINYNAM